VKDLRKAANQAEIYLGRRLKVLAAFSNTAFPGKSTTAVKNIFINLKTVFFSKPVITFGKKHTQTFAYP
jgi:hypothetical protein